MPTLTRNVSGILVHLSEDTSILLDCGESTFNQMCLLYGPERVDRELLKLRAIYISHMHADHHLGVFTVLRERERAVQQALLERLASSSASRSPNRAGSSTLWLLVPRWFLNWQREYSATIEPLAPSSTPIVLNDASPLTFPAASGATLAATAPQRTPSRSPSPPSSPTRKNPRRSNSPTATPTAHKEQQTRRALDDLMRACNLHSLQIVPVKHCPNAFGIALGVRLGPTGETFKLVYSGDTMPCESLVLAGADCDVLIHEATMETGLEKDAHHKRHSTAGEALQVAQQMRARQVILTHFSQRYSKIPCFNLHEASHLSSFAFLRDEVYPDPHPDADISDAAEADFSTAPTVDAVSAVKPNSYEGPVATAFDFIRLRVGDIARFAKLVPPIRALYSDYDIELRNRAIIREARRRIAEQQSATGEAAQQQKKTQKK